MKKLEAKRVSASEAGDYFQVLFEEDRDRFKNYFLIQRGFEFDFGERPDPCYIESDDRTFCGHIRITKAELAKNRFYLKLGDSKGSDMEIMYDTSEDNYQEVKRVVRIIFSGTNALKIKQER